MTQISKINGIPLVNNFVSGGTFTDSTLTLTRNDGGTVSTIINDFSGLTVSGTMSATTVDGANILSGGTNLSDIFVTSNDNTFITVGSFEITY